MARTRIRRGAAPLDSGLLVAVPHAEPVECPDCGTGLELQWVCERCGSRYGVPDTPEPGSPCGCQLNIENVRPNRPIIGPSVRVGNVMVRIVWCEVHRDAPETARELQAFRARQANEHEACVRLLARARDECEERDRRLAEAQEAVRVLLDAASRADVCREDTGGHRECQGVLHAAVTNPKVRAFLAQIPGQPAPPLPAARQEAP